MGRTKSFAAIGPSQTAPRQRNPFLECATLFWLGQSDRALRALCRGPAAEHNATASAPSSPVLPKECTSTVVADGVAGLGICNRSIDVATRPFLVSKLKQLQAKSKSGQGRAGGWRASVGRGGGGLLSSSNGDAAAGHGGGGGGGTKIDGLATAQRLAAVRLTTVEYLARNGMELSALEVLGRNAGGEWAAELAKQQAAKEKEVEEGEGVVSPAEKPKGFSAASGELSGELSGDMFGGFDGPPGARPNPTADAASGELSGDMFGAFDPPARARPKPAAAAASGELSGDMFGAFDPPARTRPKPKPAATAAAATSGELSGDMFDAFDPPARARPKPKPEATATAAASGELSGDMFGAFDPPARTRPKPKPEAAAATVSSGELSGDMFGAFDPPARGRPKPAAAEEAAAASGEISDDMFGDFDGPKVRVPAPLNGDGSAPVRKRLTVRSASLPMEPASPAASAIWTPSVSRHGACSPADSQGGGFSRASPRGGPRGVPARGYFYPEGGEPSWDGYDEFTERQYAEDCVEAGGGDGDGGDAAAADAKEGDGNG